MECISSILYNKELKKENSDHNHNKEIVDKEVRKDVKLGFLEFSCVEEVEDLKEDENIEK